MKKLPASMLIFVMLLSLLTACGNGNTSSTTPPGSSDMPEASASSDTPATSDPAQEDSTIEMGELESFSEAMLLRCP